VVFYILAEAYICCTIPDCYAHITQNDQEMNLHVFYYNMVTFFTIGNQYREITLWISCCMLLFDIFIESFPLLDFSFSFM